MGCVLSRRFKCEQKQLAELSFKATRKIAELEESLDHLTKQPAEGGMSLNDLKEKKRALESQIFEANSMLYEAIFDTESVKNVVKSLVKLGLDKDDVEDLLENLLISLGEYVENYPLFVKIVKGLCENAVLIASVLKNWEYTDTEHGIPAEGNHVTVSFAYPDKEKASRRLQRKIHSKVFFKTAELFAIFGKDSFTDGSGIFDSNNGYEWWIHLKKGESTNRIKQMLEIGLKPLQSTFGTCEITVK